MALQSLLRNFSKPCLAVDGSFSALLPSRVDVCLVRHNSKHWNPKFRKERAKKVLKVDLPDFDEDRKQSRMSLDEMKVKRKEKGLAPFRPWGEKQMHISCLGSIVDAYVPPEGDAKVSIMSTPGMKQTYDSIGKKGKSYMALRKIRNLDYEFDVPTVAEKAQDIYLQAVKALVKNDEDRLHELVTEKAYPEMMENMTNKTVKWSFGETLELPRIVHVRCQEMIEKDNLFGQITLRLHTRQAIAVYDRFGRLMHGSEGQFRDVLEYLVFEKQLSNPHGDWRIHGKIVPDWLPPRDPIRKTYLLPDVQEEQTPETAVVANPASTETTASASV